MLGLTYPLIVEEVTRAAGRDGVWSPLATLFAGLPAESYAATTNPIALGTGYFVFFLYSAALGTAAVALAVGLARGKGQAAAVASEGTVA